MPRRVAPEEIEAVFAEDGPLATLMPGYIPRRSQIDMALAVARTLDTPRGRLAVEAGTGTGKSLAYLVPALLSERRVVVATGTKALQDQLVDKDAPIAVAAVSALRGDDVTQTVLRMKGRNNYLCRLRWESFDRQSAFDFGNDTLVQIKRFAETTTTGDRAELVGLPDSFSLWADLDANRDTCLGQACPRYDDCYVVTLRRQAESAAVIVVNHHLLCADQRLRLESGGFDDGDNAGFGVLPVMDALIVDEAHSLPDVATDHFGLSVSTDEVGKLLIDVRRAADSCGGSERASLMDAVDEVRAAAEAFFLAAANTGRREGARDSLRPGEPVRGERLNLVGSDDLRRLGEGAHDAIETLGDVIDEARTTFMDDGVEATMVKATLTGLKERSSRLRATITYLSGPAATDKQYVCFVDKSARGVALTAAPIDVRAPLSGTMFAGDAPVVLTSATLAVGDDVEPYLYSVGLLGEDPHDKTANNDLHDDAIDASIDDDDDAGDADVAKAIFPSPFDHPKRAALYAPVDMPEPDQPTWAQQYDAEVVFLLTMSKGGALLLFTSHRAMDEAVNRLRPALDELGIPILKQGERPKGVLLDELRRLGNAALFATSSFWEGVDVGGAALRLVIIDRLPFRVPSDPLVRARAEHARSLGRDPFADLAVPEAALMLKQGAGRLLRTVNDAGVVAVLDGRLRRRRYGATFLSALPPMTRVGARKSVVQFWIRFVEPALGLPPTSLPGA